MAFLSDLHLIGTIVCVGILLMTRLVEGNSWTKLLGRCVCVCVSFFLAPNKNPKNFGFPVQIIYAHVQGMWRFFKFETYCWWKKSCTSWYAVYPIICRVLYIPGGAWCLLSTVPDFFQVFWNMLNTIYCTLHLLNHNKLPQLELLEISEMPFAPQQVQILQMEILDF